MRLRAFRGFHYASAAGDPGILAAPPFDQIDDRLRDRLHRTPHHFAHLTRPVPAAGADAYEHAATLHREWVDAGLVAKDGRPALYPYEILLPAGARRLGLCGLIDVEPPESGVIRPHEQTVAKAIEDRLALLRATRVDLEPILLLAEDGGGLESMLEEDTDGSPLASHVDAAGNRHVLHRVEAPERIAAYRRLLEPATGLIADGHHRYKVASAYAEEVGARPGSAAGSKLALLFSLASPTLSIDPIHRAVGSAGDLAAAAMAARRRAVWEGEGGAAFAAAVAAAAQPAVGVWPASGRPEIWELDPDLAPRHLNSGARALAVVLLHHALLPRLGLPETAATDGTVIYRSDPEALAGELAGGRHATGFFLPPMAPAAFAAAVADGSLLPPKSTRFLPKAISGLVWAPHDTETA